MLKLNRSGLLSIAMPVFCMALFLNAKSLDLSRQFWPAQWIAPPNASLHEYGVFHFRRTFVLEEVPSEFVIHVSADNRYRLFVNGKPVCFGPSRCDLQHWRYESVDIAPFLITGKNVLAAVVWNFGEHIPLAQMTLQTGFLLQGPADLENPIDTNADWKVYQNKAYRPIPVDGGKLRTYIVVGPGDRVDGALYPWEWEQPEYDDSGWDSPRVLTGGKPRGVGTNGDWMLIPRTLPFLEETEEKRPVVRRSSGMEIRKLAFENGRALKIPKNTKLSLLLDQTYLTTTYPELAVSGGKESQIKLTYAEALMDENHRKGNRNEVEGRQVIGFEDVFLPDGGQNRLFRPLWFRTYRYIQMNIQTEDDPLIIQDFKGIFTAYPFREAASFSCDDPALSKIWDVGWRTARLCANETYYDCPYYEQLQYVGDTRIQALISLYVSGDDRLMRKAIQVFDDSRISDGLTQSRYPCSSMQIIPPYSLFWIAMIHDFWMHRDDPVFIQSLIPGMYSVINWHAAHLDDSGLLGRMPWWHFTDWAKEWPWNHTAGVGGVPSQDDQGRSSILSLQFAYVLQMAAEMMSEFDEDALADQCLSLAHYINSAVYQRCWDPSRQLIADTPDQTVFSQHANVLGVLTNAIPNNQQKGVIERLLEEESLIQCTLYYRFYLFRAMIKVGLGDRYLEQIQSWRDMLDLGLTTFAERPEPSRSDCHAWSASPNYDFLATICGILPDEPGFKSVCIVPHLGSLKEIEGEMPHPAGMIRIQFKRSDLSGLTGTVELPAELTGRMIWNGQETMLRSGKQRVEFE